MPKSGRGGEEGADIKEGDVIEGVVKTIVDYGAFIGLGAVDGLLHISQMSHKRIKHPSEVLKKGDEVSVQVLKVDQEKNRLSLRLNDMGEDPWTDISSHYQPGMRLTGKVIHVVKFGCFVELMPEVEGLVHVSEMDWANKNVVPMDVVQPGDKVEVLIREVNEERRRIALSMKRCQPSPWESFATEHKVGEKVRGAISKITDFGVFVTLGQQSKIDGLVHISDLSWDPNQAESLLRGFAPGDELETIILSMEPERERISLGVKQLEEDLLGDYYSQHDKHSQVSGTVQQSEADPQSEERSRSPGSAGEVAQEVADEGSQVDAGSHLPDSLGGSAQGAADEDSPGAIGKNFKPSRSKGGAAPWEDREKSS